MDQEDFRELALSKIDAVYRLAFHLSRRSEEADDLVQETYLRAFKSWSSFKLTDRGIRPWLFKILHNVVNTRYAKHQRDQQLLEEFHSEAVPDMAGQAELFPDISILNWETIDERLKEAIGELPLPHRTAFLMYAVEGMRYREIAEVMGVPMGTVMSRLYRARAQLACRLAVFAAERRLGTNDLPNAPPADPDAV